MTAPGQLAVPAHPVLSPRHGDGDGGAAHGGGMSRDQAPGLSKQKKIQKARGKGQSWLRFAALRMLIPHFLPGGSMAKGTAHCP